MTELSGEGKYPPGVVVMSLVVLAPVFWCLVLAIIFIK